MVAVPAQRIGVGRQSRRRLSGRTTKIEEPVDLRAPYGVDAPNDGWGTRKQMQFREMVERAGHGDHDAFEAVVRASAGRLYAIAYRILRDADLANDALQEALVKVWDDLPALRDPERFDAWAARITCRCCYRLAKRERHFTLPVASEPRPDTTAFEGEVADQDEMERGFRRLSPDHRAVLVLHYYLGLTLGEVAETLDIPPGTVGSRLHYAMRSLRAALESEARTTQAWERSI